MSEASVVVENGSGNGFTSFHCSYSWGWRKRRPREHYQHPPKTVHPFYGKELTMWRMSKDEYTSSGDHPYLGSVYIFDGASKEVCKETLLFLYIHFTF
jgi:hypothetical protein